MLAIMMIVINTHTVYVQETIHLQVHRHLELHLDTPSEDWVY